MGCHVIMMQAVYTGKVNRSRMVHQGTKARATRIDTVGHRPFHSIQNSRTRNRDTYKLGGLSSVSLTYPSQTFPLVFVLGTSRSCDIGNANPHTISQYHCKTSKCECQKPCGSSVTRCFLYVLSHWESLCTPSPRFSSPNPPGHELPWVSRTTHPIFQHQRGDRGLETSV